MKTAYLDCFSGISGDMFAGALLGAGLDLGTLQEALGGLALEGVRVEAREEARNGIHGTRFLVHLDDKPRGERSLEDIRRIIGGSGLSERVKERSMAVFEVLALAEARIHGEPVEKVHFHEVGAADSIVDIVTAVLGLESLGIRRVFCSALPLGSGFVNSRHGTIPVPAPATLEILKGVPVKDAGVDAETVTPTGAAIVRVFADGFGSMPPLKVEQVGYGVGTLEFADRPNLLRLVVGETTDRQDADTVALLEANLDDSPPEWTGFVMERLFEAGAVDAWLVPIQMKKNRPGVLIQALTRPEDRDRLADVILRETTSLGVRSRMLDRRILQRESAEIDSPWGPLKVKLARGLDGVWRTRPEYEACRRVALEHGLALGEVYNWVYAKGGREAR
jgi:pyridinium-3,5-bisthiocarboxylic acid mononucleotide nickel chelatase